jgi:UDP-N-acetylmuramoyl-tripeptide--D-alanyl-D-alanine ligase
MHSNKGFEYSAMKTMAIAILDRLIPISVLAAYLHFWARLVIWRRKPLIVGVTGSVGKTTTTAMIASVLKQSAVERLVGRVGQVTNNMNDDVGLPATLLLFDDLKEEYPPSRLAAAFLAPWRALMLCAMTDRYPKVFVLEFGAGWGGHIARLARLAPPTIAVVTTIGPAHLERFKTVEGVAKEKIALVKAVPPTGLVILGTEHDFVTPFTEAARSPVVLVSGRGLELAENATRAVCRHLRIPEYLIDNGIRAFQPPKGRLNILQFGQTTVIDDSYNANPLSMKLGLDILTKTASPADRKVAILGFMAELGTRSPEYHREIGHYAHSRVDLLIGIGKLAKHYDPDQWFATSEACAEQIESLLGPKDCILIKGSGSAGTRRIVEKLQQI